MVLERFVGLRFLKPRRNQLLLSIVSLIAMMGIAVGVAALILVIAAITGFQDDLRSKILGAYSHVLVLSIQPTIPDYEPILEQVRTFDKVKAASPFVYSEVMLTSSSGVSGSILRGIDPRFAGEVTSLEKSLVKGSLMDLMPGPPEQADSDLALLNLPGIILGSQLAASLRVFQGDVVNIVSPMGETTPMGTMPKMKKFLVTGLFDSGMFEFDAKFAYIHLSEAQSFFGIGDAISGIEVKVDDVMQAQDVAEDLQSALGFPLRTKDWMHMNRNLLSALKLEKVALFFILTLIIFVASLNIFSTLYMVVKDKRRSIAILRAMGASAGQIRRIFIFQGMTIGTLGGLTGFTLGMAGVWAQIHWGIVRLNPDVYNIDRLPMILHPLDFALIALAAIGLSFVATIIPAHLASRTDSLEVLRYE